jgi:hypothetical protein
MYLVEVRYTGEDLAGPMAELREWLDLRQIEPSCKRRSENPSLKRPGSPVAPE